MRFIVFLGLVFPLFASIFFLSGSHIQFGRANKKIFFGVYFGGYFSLFSLISSWLALATKDLFLSLGLSSLILIVLNIIIFYDKFTILAFKFPVLTLKPKFFLLFTFIALAIERVIVTINYGDNTWDSNSQHLPMVLGLFQSNSLFPEPSDISLFQYYPALVQAIGVALLYVTQNVSYVSLMQLPWLIGSIFIWLGMTDYVNLKNKNNKSVLYLGILSSPPLILSFGVSYVDFSIAWGFTILIFALYSLIRENYLLPTFLLGLAIATTLTGKMATWPALFVISLSMLVISILRIRPISTLYRKISLVLFFSSFGFVYLIRSFVKFQNFFYPGTNYFNSKGNGPLNLDFVNGMLRNSADPQISNTNHLFSFFWNWFGSIEDWIKIHLNFESYNLSRVYAHDARVVGNGIIISLILTLLFISILWKFEFTKYNYYLIFPIILIAALTIPEPASMRYMWGLTIPLAILGMELLNFNYRQLQTIAIIAIGSILLTQYTISQDSKDRLNLVQKSEYKSLGSYYLTQSKQFTTTNDCPVVGLEGDLPTYATPLWLNQSCTKVLRTDLITKPIPSIDITSFLVTNNSICDEYILDFISYLKVEARWGTDQSTLFFVKTSDFLKDSKMQTCVSRTSKSPRY